MITTSKDFLCLRNRLVIVLIFVVMLVSKFATASVPAYAFGVGAFSIASGPTAIAIGDLNGDGRPDLVISDGSGVSVLLGRTDGSFAPHVEYSTGQFAPVGLALGDFNGDGKPDIVTIVGASYQVLLGNGDGTFKTATSIQLSSLIGTSSVAIADFNKDGRLDIAIAGGTFAGSVVAVLLGNGDGTFGKDVEYSTAGSVSVITGDFNSDGNTDLALGSGDSGVSVLLGKGDGTFGSYIVTPIPTNGAGSLATADLNHDGKLDLAAGSYPYYPGGVSVLIGNGDGTFASPVFYAVQPVGNGPNVVAIADFNGDGKPDIASANNDGFDTSVLLGNGDGTFKSAKNYPGSIDPIGIVSGDFNGDGIEDIASVAGYNISAAVTVLIGRGDGTFSGHVNRTIAPYPYDMSAGDFNDDGNPDIVVDSFGTPGAASVLLGNGKGSFTIHKDAKIGNSPLFLSTGDFNGDGSLDVVLVDSDPKSGTELLSTLLGNGDGTFQPALTQTMTSVPAGEFGVADFNLDGKLDVATCLQITSGPSVFFGNGDGTFASSKFFDAGDTCGDPGSVFTADVNGDHKPDLLVTTYNGISVLLGEGNGSFQTYSAILSGYTLQGIGDFNGDGIQDLVVTSGPPFVGIALGNGDGTFQAPQTVYIPGILNVYHGVVGDFNGDGKLDFAFTSEFGPLSILLGNGDGTFGQRIDLPTENSPYSLAAADFIADTGLDIAVANAVYKGNGTLSIFANRPVAALYPSPLEFGSVKVGNTNTLNTNLYNSGGAPLKITAIKVTSQYTQTNTCGSTLTVGSSCVVSVTFKPTRVGQHNGSLSIQDDAAAKPQVVVLSASGVK